MEQNTIKTYNVITEDALGEFEEKKSRFIASIHPVNSEEDALAFINSIRKKHYDARHNCYAFIIGPGKELMRSSDDGEPQGTAGKPMLEVLNGYDVTNVVAVVTRYFGGTLLGTGGLVRAYTQAMKEAMETAQIATIDFCSDISVTVGYSDINNLQHYFEEADIKTVSTDYLENVTMTIRIKADRKEDVVNKLTSLTKGQGVINIISEGYYPL